MSYFLTLFICCVPDKLPVPSYILSTSPINLLYSQYSQFSPDLGNSSESSTFLSSIQAQSYYKLKVQPRKLKVPLIND